MSLSRTLLTALVTLAALASGIEAIRLPTHLIPERYNLRLIPFIIPNNFTIKGNVQIQFK